MADDQRVYSDEEFALILRKATELASKAELPVNSSAGLTLAEMKSAAVQVGLDPALVERAARMLVTKAAASPLERLTGGPLHHNQEVRFPVKLDENSAARLLSAVRVRAALAGHQDVGHSSAMGMTWHDGGAMEALGVAARPEEDGTVVSVSVDRRGTLLMVAMPSGIVMFLAVLFSVFALYPAAHPLGYVGLIAAIGAPLGLARRYWASSTKKLRERMSVVMDAMGQALSRPEIPAQVHRAVGDAAVTPEGEASVGVDAEAR
ncbi:MAG: hypothetical protein ABJB66_07160 [Gemmatimonadaceae bacterium]